MPLARWPEDRSRPQPRSGRRIAPSLDRSEDSAKIVRVMARVAHKPDASPTRRVHRADTVSGSDGARLRSHLVFRACGLARTRRRGSDPPERSRRAEPGRATGSREWVAPPSPVTLSASQAAPVACWQRAPLLMLDAVHGASEGARLGADVGATELFPRWPLQLPLEPQDQLRERSLLSSGRTGRYAGLTHTGIRQICSEFLQPAVPAGG